MANKTEKKKNSKRNKSEKKKTGKRRMHGGGFFDWLSKKNTSELDEKSLTNLGPSNDPIVDDSSNTPKQSFWSSLFSSSKTPISDPSSPLVPPTPPTPPTPPPTPDVSDDSDVPSSGGKRRKKQQKKQQKK
jgi:hypothetical protein